MSFPENFIWGAATSSYQIEGAPDLAARGQSIWDRFSNEPGKTEDNLTGESACDHINHFRQDVQLMSDIGLQAYRFSISWPRVLPDGTGSVNTKGLDFYDALVDSLLEHQIDPWVTLYHWDLPVTLHNRGGWLNRDISNWFAEYTKLVVDRLSDRVQNWIPINEPQVVSHLGYFTGEHAPGHRHSLKDVILTVHNGLLAHGRAVQVIRDRAVKPPNAGTAIVGIHNLPATQDENHIKAAEISTFSVYNRDVWNSSWFGDPIFLGVYPEDGLNLYGSDLPDFPSTDLEVIHQPLDFCGLNIYHGNKTPDSLPANSSPAQKIGFDRTAMGWPVTPEALYWGPRFFYQRYGLPIVITENGMANCDWIHSDGEVHDPQRTDFHLRYLKNFKKAGMEGIPVSAYFLWSLMDNFEWAFGYNRRFGIIHVDFETQKRTMKDSAFWYRQIITSNGIEL